MSSVSDCIAVLLDVDSSLFITHESYRAYHDATVPAFLGVVQFCGLCCRALDNYTGRSAEVRAERPVDV